MKRVELIRTIEGFGCEFVRHGGKHDWYRNSNTGVSSRSHDTGKSRTISRGTFSKCSVILRGKGTVKAMKKVPLSEVKDDLSKYLRIAEKDELNGHLIHFKID